MTTTTTHTDVPTLLHSIAALLPASLDELVGDFDLPEMPVRKLLEMDDVFGYDASKGRYFLVMPVIKVYELIRRMESEHAG